MKHHLHHMKSIATLLVIAVSAISLLASNSGLIPVQAKSVLRPSEQVPPAAILTPTRQADQNNLHQQGKTKGSLERLLNLINASEVSAAGSSDPANLAKLDSHLQDLISDRLSGMDVTKAAQNYGLTVSASQAVLMDIYIHGPLDQVVTRLKGLGMQVLATNQAFGGSIEGYLPVDSILPAARLTQTRALLPVMGVDFGTGSVTSEGDAAHNGPAARALGADGAGVVIGVISDSMNQVGTGLVGSQAMGDLPAGVTILNELTGYNDEGRAMAEIVYDTAPGVTSMFFDSGICIGAICRAAAINNLVTHGVDIIADDVADWSEPFFQDGVVAQAVEAAYATGVAYFASAGNYARQSYESYFNDNGLTAHDFDPGENTDILQQMTTVQNGYSIKIFMQWDDPWGAATHDYDLRLFDVNDTSSPLEVGATDNLTTGLPIETIYWTNNTGAPVTVGLFIRLVGQTEARVSYLKYLTTSKTIDEWDTASSTISPDAASASGAMTVAAVRWDEPGLNDPESFSSRGPVFRLFGSDGSPLSEPEFRQKPDFAAADCVSTSFNFSGGTFCGTSAAVSSMAGVAALVLSMQPSLTVDELYEVLANPDNTIDCTLAGNPDEDCGYGFVLADKAVASVILTHRNFLPLVVR
jgi:hypothetical protein